MAHAIGKGILAFLSALAQDERERILARANGGRKAAKLKGVKFGRKPKLTDHQRVEALRRLESGDSARAIGRDLNVSHLTVLKVAAA